MSRNVLQQAIELQSAIEGGRTSAQELERERIVKIVREFPIPEEIKQRMIKRIEDV